MIPRGIEAPLETFATELGAEWAGGSDEAPPEPLDAAIIFAPDGALVPAALTVLAPGGTLVLGGIHMSDIPSFPLRAAVARAHRPLGREPDPPRRRGVPRTGARGAGEDDGHVLSARGGQ
jgi:hypothetical protein